MLSQKHPFADQCEDLFDRRTAIDENPGVRRQQEGPGHLRSGLRAILGLKSEKKLAKTSHVVHPLKALMWPIPITAEAAALTVEDMRALLFSGQSDAQVFAV